MAKITNNNTKEINGLTTNVAVILNKVEYIENEVKEIKDKLESNYVTMSEFKPIKAIVYGMVAIVLTTVFGALIMLVVKK